MTLSLTAVALSLFTFQNNFWVNLHQLLHAEAVKQRAGTPLTIATAAWSAEEQAGWKTALTAYLDGKLTFEEALRNVVRDLNR